MEVLAIIPARGGSKGIPRKNVIPLCGKPLITWSIEAAKAAKCVHRIIVSTDDTEISAIAKEYGAEVVLRPAKISGDEATSETALLHVLNHLQETEGYKPDLIVFLQCSSPLTTAGDIDKTVRTLCDNKAHSALSVTDFHYYLWHRDKEGNAAGINHNKCERLPRQKRHSQYLETGSVYVMEINGFLKNKHRFFGKTVMCPIPSQHVIEIDEPNDLQVAESMMREVLRNRKLDLLPNKIEAVVFDFDGVFTDNTVMLNQDGCEAVVCNRGDGMGIELLRTRELHIFVLSSETNPVGRARCKKLEIDSLFGVKNKLLSLDEWLTKKGIASEKVIYVGNDVNDIPCMQRIGCAVAVADAYPSVKRECKIILDSPGGHGAIRELVELIIKKQTGGNNGEQCS